MSPLKKRAKIAKEAIVELTSGAVDDVFATLASEPDNQDHWIGVATLQQRMLQKIRQQEDELHALRKKKSKREQDKMAAQYERDHLQNQIEEYRLFPLTNLEQLAREECSKEESSSNAIEGASREEILHKFLQVDINDPNQKDAVTLKLQKCFEHRAELGKKVQGKRQALKSVQQKLKAQNDFLTSLPMHIQTLDRASQSLVKFMQKNGLMHPLSGNERSQRLRRAQTLPPPMYTLFTLLQRAIDEHPGVTIKIVAGNSNSNNNYDHVVLQFPIPDIAALVVVAATAKKPRQFLSITFGYEGGQIKVESAGGASLIQNERLLDDLFEGDSAAATTPGAYMWANQLAGIHPVAAVTAPATVASTGLVLHEIERRIHAYAILHHCLSELQRGKVPTPPGTETLSKRSVTFTKEPDNAVRDDLCYAVTIENAIVDVKVNVPRSQYPARPPIWTIPREKSVENRVNVNLLRTISEEDGPWILIHQVRVLLDAVGNDSTVAAGRTRKGRNRKND